MSAEYTLLAHGELLAVIKKGASLILLLLPLPELFLCSSCNPSICSRGRKDTHKSIFELASRSCKVPHALALS